MGSLSGARSGSFGVRLTPRDTKREMSSSVSLTRSASEDSLAATRWVETQTRCFLAVGQSELRLEHVAVQLVHDLTSGVCLARLIETLAGKKVGGVVQHRGTSSGRLSTATTSSSSSRTGASASSTSGRRTSSTGMRRSSSGCCGY